jgi:hypothetical protein
MFMLINLLLEEWKLEKRKIIYPLKIDRQDDLNPMDEPNPALDGSSGRGKARPDFFTRARWFGTKIVPPRTPHGMSECLGRPLV